MHIYHCIRRRECKGQGGQRKTTQHKPLKRRQQINEKDTIDDLSFPLYRGKKENRYPGHCCSGCLSVCRQLIES